MDRSKKLSETEYEIMEVLWNSEAPMSASQILSYFAEYRNKDWKAQTLATSHQKERAVCLIIGRSRRVRNIIKVMHSES